MHHTSYTLTFVLDLRPRMMMRGDRVPCVGETIVLGHERWRVSAVEWANSEETYVVLPTLVLAPSWDLHAQLRELAASQRADGTADTLVASTGDAEDSERERVG